MLKQKPRVAKTKIGNASGTKHEAPRKKGKEASRYAEPRSTG